jgi:hypothetical protein
MSLDTNHRRRLGSHFARHTEPLVPIRPRDYWTRWVDEIIWPGRAARAESLLQRWDEGQHPREPAGSSEGGQFTSGGGGAGAEGGFEFVSPNVSNIGLAVAHNALKGERQNALKQASGEVDRTLGITSEDHDIIGAWKDGAENSLMSVSKGTSWDKLRVSGAMKGWLGDQKQVLLFRDEKDGPAVLYKFESPDDVHKTHEKMLANGLAFHTLVPHKDGTTVYIADLDGSLHDSIAKASGKADVEYRHGKAEFIGTQSEAGDDRQQRDDARRAYEKIISQSPVQGSDAAWNRIRNRWGETLTKPHPLTADSIMIEAPAAKRNSLSIKDVAKQLNARAGHILQQQFGKSSIEKSSPETDDYLASSIADGLKASLTNGHASPTWYSDKMKAAMKIAESMHPEIAKNPDKRFGYIAAMAITSQGETVDSNVRLAEQAYKQFNETGKFPTNLEVKNSGINGNMEKMNKLIDRFGVKGTHEFFDKEMTVRELKDMTGYKVGRSSMDDVVNGSAVLGPKIGLGFYQNLNGNFKPLTADIWFMRAWGRMTNTGIGQPDMAPVADRLRNALKEEGQAAPTDLDKLDKIATEIFDQHERDYAKHSDEYKSGKRSKTELVYAAERFVDNYGGKMVEAPRGAQHRQFITSVFNKALDKLKAQGIDLSPAAAQATWWNPEKVLYQHLGGRTKDVFTDYEKSLSKYEKEHGAAT